MDGWICLWLVLLAAPLALAVVALVIARETSRRLQTLERRVAELSRAPQPAAETPPPVPVRERPASALDALEELTGRRTPARADAAPPAPLRAPLPPPAPKLRKERAPVDWERWIGVRGFAVAGGVVLALAGIYFFVHAVERGWVTPALRVGAGIVFGSGCVLASERLRKKRFAITPDALAGAGAVVLYASFWAANRLYQFAAFPLWVTFVAMAGVTALCVLLALRHGSLLIAVLGLVGGFATPLLLAGGEDRPIGLFGYILLLDLGLLAAGRKRRWPLLGMLGLLGTAAIQALWVRRHLDPDELVPALLGLGAFALVFAASGRGTAGRERAFWLVGQAGGLLLPFVFAMYFASRVDLGATPIPLTGLAVLLAVASTIVGRAQDAPWLPASCAAASLALASVWTTNAVLTDGQDWKLAACAVAMAGAFHAFSEWGLRRGASATAARPLDASAIAAAGGVAVVAYASLLHEEARFLPLFSGCAVLAAMLYRQAAAPARAWLQIVGATVLGLALVVLAKAGADRRALLTSVVAVGLVVAFVRRTEVLRRQGHLAAGALIVLALFAMERADPRHVTDPAGYLASALLLGAAAAFAASGARSSLPWIFGTLTLLVVQAERALDFNSLAEKELTCALVLAASAVVVTALPFAMRRATWKGFAWRISGFSGALWLPLVAATFHRTELANARYLPALALGLATAAGGALALRSRSTNQRIPDCASAWYGATAAGLLTLAAALAVYEQWPTVHTALFGAALALLWIRLDHLGLKVLSVALVAASFFSLVVKAITPEYHEHEEALLWNWITYAHVVPASAFGVCVYTFGRFEAARVRPLERKLGRGLSWGALLCGTAAIATLFLWLNFLVLNAFEEEHRIRLAAGRLPARDLTLSLVWALYGLALLGAGLVRRRGSGRALRWASLLCLLATIAKVFLYDLGELEGLYRVGSLLGLALCLMLVSLLYQRFVFRRPLTSG